jgi:hypothetical protein
MGWGKPAAAAWRRNGERLKTGGRPETTTRREKRPTVRLLAPASSLQRQNDSKATASGHSGGPHHLSSIRRFRNQSSQSTRCRVWYGIRSAFGDSGKTLPHILANPRNLIDRHHRVVARLPRSLWVVSFASSGLAGDGASAHCVDANSLFG